VEFFNVEFLGVLLREHTISYFVFFLDVQFAAQSGELFKSSIVRNRRHRTKNLKCAFSWLYLACSR
jgi:hypothetical protein